MDELEKQVKAFADMLYANAMRQGWWDGSTQERTPEGIRFRLTQIALMHSELGEATEGIRKPRPDDHVPEFMNEVVELGDAVMRIIDYCNHYGLPLVAAMKAKAKFNLSRPHKHGKEY